MPRLLDDPRFAAAVGPDGMPDRGRFRALYLKHRSAEESARRADFDAQPKVSADRPGFPGYGAAQNQYPGPSQVELEQEADDAFVRMVDERIAAQAEVVGRELEGLVDQAVVPIPGETEPMFTARRQNALNMMRLREGLPHIPLPSTGDTLPLGEATGNMLARASIRLAGSVGAGVPEAAGTLMQKMGVPGGASVAQFGAENRAFYDAGLEGFPASRTAGGFQPTNPRWWLEQGGENLVNLAGQVGLTAAMGPLGPLTQGAFAATQGVGAEFAGFVGDAEKGYMAQGVKPEEARTLAQRDALAYSAVAGVLERLSVGELILKDRGAMNRLTRAARGAMFEGSTEAAQELAAVITELAGGSNPNQSGAQIAERLLASMTLGAAGGGVVAGAIGGGGGASQSPAIFPDSFPRIDPQRPDAVSAPALDGPVDSGASPSPDDMEAAAAEAAAALREFLQGGGAQASAPPATPATDPAGADPQGPSPNQSGAVPPSQGVPETPSDSSAAPSADQSTGALPGTEPPTGTDRVDATSASVDKGQQSQSGSSSKESTPRLGEYPAPLKDADFGGVPPPDSPEMNAKFHAALEKDFGATLDEATALYNESERVKAKSPKKAARLVAESKKKAEVYVGKLEAYESLYGPQARAEMDQRIRGGAETKPDDTFSDLPQSGPANAPLEVGGQRVEDSAANSPQDSSSESRVPGTQQQPGSPAAVPQAAVPQVDRSSASPDSIKPFRPGENVFLLERNNLTGDPYVAAQVERVATQFGKPVVRLRGGTKWIPQDHVSRTRPVETPPPAQAEAPASEPETPPTSGEPGGAAGNALVSEPPAAPPKIAPEATDADLQRPQRAPEAGDTGAAGTEPPQPDGVEVRPDAQSVPTEAVRPDEGSGDAAEALRGPGGSVPSGVREDGGAGGRLAGGDGDRAGGVPAAQGGEPGSVGGGRKPRGRGRNGEQPAGEAPATAQPDGVDQPKPVPAEKSVARRNGGDNFVIPDGDDPLGIEAMTPMQKVEANIAAIKALRAIKGEGRSATAEERVVLSKYTGWGHSGQLFADDRTGRWKQLHDEVKSLLSEEDYATARRTTQYAHYTSIGVIRSVWGAVTDAYGFNGGSVLEPGAGIGHFLGAAPAGVRPRVFATAVEMDPTSAGIMALLYEGHNIVQAPFEKVKLGKGSVDLAIGNPPFGDIVIADPVYDAIKPRIHDYFFLKSLDALRPGGLLVFITSKGTMDKAGTKVRGQIADRAEFVGAVRLPSTAFNRNAHTKVVTDVIVLQKRAEGAPISEQTKAFIGTTKIDDPAGIAPIEVNRYFADNPGMVIGTIQRAKSGGLRGADEATVLVDEGTDIAAELAKRLASLAPRIDRAALDGSVGAEPAAVVDTRSHRQRREGAFGLSEDGKTLTQVAGGESKVYVGKPAVVDRVMGLVRVRDALRAAIAAQAGNAPESMVQETRDALNTAYDRFVKKHGPINAQANVRAFRDDPDAVLIKSIEKWDAAKKTAEKADIFSKRVIGGYTPPTQAQSAVDALAISLNTVGNVDPALMSRLYGKPVDTVMKELGDRVYFTPEGEWQTSDQYLTGNVRAKLAAARAAAEENPALERNVKALEDVQPPEVSWGDVVRDIRPGMPFVGADVVSKFTRSVLGQSVSVLYLAADAKWQVMAAWYDMSSAKATADFGTPDAPAPEIMEDVLNGRTPVVRKKGADGKPYVDRDASAAAAAKARAIVDEFRKWLMSPENAASAETVHRRYNETFNSNRLPVFDGSHLTFPTLSTAWKSEGRTLRPHQRNAVWCVIQGNALLAHVVGAGKSAVMIASGMEMRRMGVVKKPLYVIPNHMVESGQFASDLLSMYPGGRVLVATRAEFEAKKRKAFLSRIATGDWDAVVMGHSTFGMIPMSEGFGNRFVQEQLSEMRDAIRWVEANLQGREKTRTVKNIETSIQQMEQRFERMIARAKKDDLLHFDELGIDYLFVDEAHNFKKPYIRTNKHNVKGIQTSDSARGLDLWMKTSYLHGVRPGKSITFATGTPITNTVGEAFVMMRYLMPQMLKSAGVGHFDAWAASFGETQTLIERELSGGAWKETTRFNKIVNIPELMQQWRTLADVQTAEMLKLPTPELDTGKPIVITVPQTDAQRAFTRALQSRVEAIRSGQVKPWEDGMFLISVDGRKAGLDMRLKDPQLGPEEGGLKLARVADEITAIFNETASEKLTQLVFADIGKPRDTKPPPGQFGDQPVQEQAAEDETPEPSADEVSAESDFGGSSANADETGGRFSTYDELRRLLVERGIPSKQIAFIHHYADKAPMRTWIQQQVREGNIRVLVGSTKLMGEGMNVQDRLVALHHLDSTWTPAEIEQREGRILRQGNKNKKVRIYRYVTEGSFDAVMWQKILQKAQFIKALMTGAVTSRSAEDIGTGELNADEAFAAAAGDPRILRRFELERKVSELESQQSGWVGGTLSAAKRAQSLREQADSEDARSARVRAEVERIKREHPTKWTKDTPGVLEGGPKPIREKDAANKALAAWIKGITIPDGKIASPEVESPFTYRGFRVVAAARFGVNDTRYHFGKLYGTGRPPVSVEFNADATDIVLSMDTNIENLAKQPEEAAAFSERARKEAAQFEKRSREDWPDQKELDDTRAQLDRLLAELAPPPNSGGAAGGSPDVTPGTVGRSPGFESGFFSVLPEFKRQRARLAWNKMSHWFRTGEIDGSKFMMSGPGLPDPVMREAVVLGKLVAEAGARRFTAWARAYVSQVGAKITPHLKAIYEGVRARADSAPFRGEMTPPDEVNALSDEQVQEILDTGTGRVQEADVAGLRSAVDKAMKGENVGRPDLNNPGTTPTARAAVQGADEIMGRTTKADQELERQADERIKDYAKARSDIIAQGLAGGMLSDVDTRVARRIIDQDGLRAFSIGDAQEQMEFATLMLAYRESRGEVARSLRAGGDLDARGRQRALSKFGIFEAISTPPRALRKKIKRLREQARTTGNKARAAELLREANRLQKEWVESARPKVVKRLRSFGVDLSTLTDADLEDVRRVGLIRRTIRGVISGKGDWFREWVIAGYVSAVASQTANVVGNVTNTVLRTFAQRFIEAGLNLAVNDPESARFGEFVPMYRAVIPALARSFRNAAQAWVTEMPALEQEVGGGTKIDLEGAGAAIPSFPVRVGGRTLEVGGRQVRIPLRALLAADEFIKGFNFTLHAAAVAYRTGKAKGMKPDALEAFITKEASNTESRSAVDGLEYAEEVAFQDEPTSVGKIALKVREKVPGLWMFVPFIKTVDRIYAAALKTTPLGLVPILWKFMSDGKLYAGNKRMEDAAQQVLAFGLLLALMSLLDDDEPIITGNVPRASGARDLSRRVAPPQSIRIGGEWYSYARIEPLATSLATMIDGLNTIDRVKKGQNPLKAMSEGWSAFVGQTQDKSFLHGISDVLTAVEQGDPSRLALGIVTPIVPNIVKSGLRSADDVIREQRTWGSLDQGRDKQIVARLQYGLWPEASIAPPPKVDLWGRPVTKYSFGGSGTALSDWLYRMAVPVNIVKADQVDPLDRLILNWNNENPNEVYAPEGVANFLTVTRADGSRKRINMTDEEYHEYASRSGQMAHQLLQSMGLDPEKPKRDDIRSIREVIERARRATLLEMFSGRFNEAAAEVAP